MGRMKIRISGGGGDKKPSRKAAFTDLPRKPVLHHLPLTPVSHPTISRIEHKRHHGLLFVVKKLRLR